ncbi:MAG: UDP-N-acetylglucosamine 1-carboxyvinyltransferase [Kiritimatiellae bacterium]|nr:UDP-N-acetylglucosamine 1-carboxyvinyltransferase [Kiritimatiellia bacterium]
MSKFIIKGGNKISGTHHVPGNKNAALPMLAATLLADSPVTLENIPDIVDVHQMIEGLKALGANVTGSPAEHCVTIDATHIKLPASVPAKICTTIRTSFLFAGPCLARCGKISLGGAPGGDSIGRRRLDTHVNGFREMGVSTTFNRSGSIMLKCKNERLHGAHFVLDETSVMATENLVMAAVLAEGTTTLYNVACEPHVQNLCNMLSNMGAQIEGISTNRLIIHGVPHLSGGTFRVGGDAIEAASYIVAALVTKGSLTLKGVEKEEMDILLPAFRKFGVRWTVDAASRTLHLPGDQKLATAYDLGKAIPKIEDGPWPMTPSDLLSVLIVLATQTRGTELFFEKMFESRLYFVDHLIGMGARIVQCDPHRAVVTGPTHLHGSTVSSPDIRAGIALIIAALCAKGETIIHNAESIDRGYERVEENLKALGARIVRKP